MCRPMARNRPWAPPQLGQRPIEAGWTVYPSFLSRPAAVSGNAPPVSTPGSSWTTWTVDTGYTSRHHFPLAPTGPSTNPREWYGVGLSDVQPWGDSLVEACIEAILGHPRQLPWSIVINCGILLR